MNVGKRYVLGLIVVLACICMLDVSVISASSTDADYYAKVLKNQQFIADADGNMEQGIDFILYDINKDGRKELIVSGVVGPKAEDVSIIYSPKKNKYIKTVILGRVEKVSSKGVYTSDWCQSGAGLYHSEMRYVYKIGSSGKAYMVLSEYTDSEYDMRTKKDKITGVGYFKYNDGKETKITKKKYQSLIQKYKLKRVYMRLITTENIKKHVK